MFYDMLYSLPFFQAKFLPRETNRVNLIQKIVKASGSLFFNDRSNLLLQLLSVVGDVFSSDLRKISDHFSAVRILKGFIVFPPVLKFI